MEVETPLIAAADEMEVDSKPPELQPEVLTTNATVPVTESAVIDLKSEIEETNGIDVHPEESNHVKQEVLTSECLDDPNFAIICSFFEKFGQFLQLGEIAYDDLQTMLENTSDVLEPLMKLHVMLLRRVYKNVPVDKWEKFLARFGHAYCSQDGWEIERFGYKKSKLQTKLRLLKNLLEAQFDYNVKFKAEVNKLQAVDLRLTPLGRDSEGQLYWYQVDNDANLRVYREDVDDETWEIVACTREGLVDLISKLQHGDVKRPEAAVILDEDSNEKEIETKEILRDTGLVEDDEEDSSDSESDNEPIVNEKTNEKVPSIFINHGTVQNSAHNPVVTPTKIDIDEHMEIDENPPILELSVNTNIMPDQIENNDDRSSGNDAPDISVVTKVDNHAAAKTDENMEVSVKVTISSVSETYQEPEPNISTTKDNNMNATHSETASSKSPKRDQFVDDLSKDLKPDIITETSQNISGTVTVTPVLHEDSESSTGVRTNITEIGLVGKEEVKVMTDDDFIKSKSDIEDVVAKSESIPLSTKADLKSPISKEEIAVEEPLIVPSKTWVCGERDETLPPKTESSNAEDPSGTVEASLMSPKVESSKADNVQEMDDDANANLMPPKTEPSNTDDPQAPVDDGTLIHSITETINSDIRQEIGKDETVIHPIAEPSSADIPEDHTKSTELASTSVIKEEPLILPVKDSFIVGENDNTLPPNAAAEESKDNIKLNEPDEEEKIPPFSENLESKSESQNPSDIEMTTALPSTEDVHHAPLAEDVVKIPQKVDIESEESKMSVDETVCEKATEGHEVVPNAIEKNTDTVQSQKLNSEIPASSSAGTIEETKVLTEECLEPENELAEGRVIGEPEPDLSTEQKSVEKTTESDVVKDELLPSTLPESIPESQPEHRPTINSEETFENKDSTVAISTSIPELGDAPTLPINLNSTESSLMDTQDFNKVDAPNEKLSAVESQVENSTEPVLVIEKETTRTIQEIQTETNDSFMTDKASKSITPIEPEILNSTNNETNTVPETHLSAETVREDVMQTESESSIKSPISNGISHEPIVQTPISLTTEQQGSATESKDTKARAPLGLSGLVSYGSSSDEDDDENDDAVPNSTVEQPTTGKRKAEEENDKDVEAPSKFPKLEQDVNTTSTSVKPPFNPIVGETIEETVFKITGEGSGAACEGGNDPVELEDNNQKENLNNMEEAGSTNEDSQDSTPVVQAPKKRGRKPGSGKKKPGPKPPSTPKTPGTGAPRGRKRKEISQLGIPLDTLLEVNGGDTGHDNDNDRPVRASRRIAQIRQKEEEERRLEEEHRLAQLKAAQIRKQQKREEMEKNRVSSDGTIKKGPGRPKKSEFAGVEYLPSPSESESASDGNEEDGDEFSVGKKKKKKRRRRKDGKPKVGGKPWATSSSDEDSEAVEEEEEYHYEEEEHLIFNESDHEFSPESDLGDDDDARPLRHARTAKRGEVEEEETGCKRCSKGDHPEWILLCDKCDHGWHASCLRPQLWVIPEGEWFCPPCQHIMLIQKLNENLIEYDKLSKRRENEILRKKRLSFVAISLDNVLPDKEKPLLEAETPKSKHNDRYEEKKRRSDNNRSRRRRILSDEEISDNFINDNSGASHSGSARGGVISSEEDSDGPIYRLRARRAAKTFDYKAYDDMINSACRASDDDGGELEEPVEPELEADEDAEGITDNGDGVVGVNGDPIEEEDKPSGKNEAYEKHLKSLEEAGEGGEGEETDEELLDEKEKTRRRELKRASGNKRKKRSFRDLDDFTDEDNSDEDFKGSEGDDDEEVDEDAVEEDESDWSGDKDESDDSLAAQSRSKGKKGKYGRQEKYLEVGSVRRSTRRRKSRISYDESDEEEEEEEAGEKWQSNESEEDEETPSESDDETYGKRKKKKTPPKASTPKFFLGAITKPKNSSKKKKKKVDEDDVDRAWSSSQGSKAKKSMAEQKVERRTRGRQINFKDILDSGESDDDGNILPKRRRISSGEEDEDEAETSRRLAEQIRAANQREEAMYAMQQKQAQQGSTIGPGPVKSTLDGGPNNGTPGIEMDPSIEAMTAMSKSQPLPPVPIPMLENNMVEQKAPILGKEQELAILSRPVPAPPLPPSLIKAVTQGRNKKSKEKEKDEKNILKSQLKSQSAPISAFGIPIGLSSAGMGLPPPTSVPGGIPPPPVDSPLIIGPSSSVPIPPNLSSPSKKHSSKSSSSSSPSVNPAISQNSPMRPMTPPMQQSHGGLPQQLPPGMPIDISRVPNPAHFQGNPAMRPFHPMWVRNPGPSPYGNNGGSPPTSIGKPPPLNSSPFMSQHGGHIPQRPGYPSPPPLRIPNPSNSPLQAFQQHFGRRDPGIYRMPPGGPGQVGLPGILPGIAGLVPHQGFGGSPYPYGLMSPHSQSQPPQSMFGAPPFDFRHGDTFKDESRSNPPAPNSPPPSGPPPSSQPSAVQQSSSNAPSKDDATPAESEFGGLVSYFSSQRSEDDMDN